MKQWTVGEWMDHVRREVAHEYAVLNGIEVCRPRVFTRRWRALMRVQQDNIEKRLVQQTRAYVAFETLGLDHRFTLGGDDDPAWVERPGERPRGLWEVR